MKFGIFIEVKNLCNPKKIMTVYLMTSFSKTTIISY